MRKPIVAGNWKMHGNKFLVKDLLSQFKAVAKEYEDKIEIAVFPPFLYLSQAKELLQQTAIKLGAQNAYPAFEGAYTGEISPGMLKELGCDYVLVGHSERRHLFGESNELVADKFIFAGECGLKPILCVGETREERESDRTFEVIQAQLNAVLLQEKGPHLLTHALIAYEPVWAIGTGLTATPDQAQEVHVFIRQEVTKINKTLAEKLRILYGGSLKQNNASALFAMPDIDGGLVGGASLNAKEFLEIIKQCSYF